MSKIKLLMVRTGIAVLDRVPRRRLLSFIHAAQKRYDNYSQLNDIAAVAIAHSSDTAATINSIVKATNQQDVAEYLIALVNSRSQLIHRLFATCESIESDLVRATVDLLRTDNNGGELPQPILDRYLTIARASGLQIQRKLELQILLAELKAERLDRALNLIATSKAWAIHTLPGPHRTGLLRCARKNGTVEYENLRRAIDSGLTELDQLKLLDIDISAGLAAQKTHNDFVAEFVKSGPKSFVREFCNIVKPFYDKHDLKFMDARVNPTIAEELLSVIKQALKSQAPLALVRAGDGEAYAFSSETGMGLATVQDESMREQHWWGCELQQSMRSELQTQIRDALENADIIGVPSVFRFIRDSHFSTKSLSSTVSMRGLATVMSCIKPKTGAIITEDRIHQVIFSRERLMELIRITSGRVVVVSSLRDELLSDIIPGSHSITIPTHHKMKTNSIFTTGDVSLPYVYQSTVHIIHQTVRQGDLVLVAGGIIGKIFAQVARNCGAVALDVGSMFDYAAGAKTRSVADVI